ncbi:MAG: GTPase [Butyrivibrio sp.]|uniref:TIGR03943 family putative permease subunit n=1 Tax=Butyrivibrio sp. TaxID=28121 RepID=UPI001B1D22C0|nr:GTP-binding protein [Butyrivibrio sp.]MBO6240881.1 GTPase [Butyrivibrio sp.]
METVYFVNGFLEAGKTTFIKELIGRESFRISGKTLILLCEEGDLEYDEDELAATDSVIEVIEEEEDFNEENIATLEKKHKPERIIVEFNGMWDRKKLEFPWDWDDIIEIAVFDAATFKLYSDNMRPLLAEQVRHAELIMFYKSDEVRDKLASYARNIKAINNGAAFVFRGEKGDIILDPDENLPYDIKADELFLDDESFAVMCMDSLERYKVYEGKKVHFKACVYKMKDGGDFEFIAGRQIMTCCEADMSFTGIICGYQKAYELENKEWVEISGILKVRFDEIMQRDIPVCRVIALKRVDAPEVEIISLL